MDLEPIGWNVVVIGYWNRAILTPGNIGKHLFGYEKGTPLAIEIPTDGIAPFRIRHNELPLVVMAHPDRIEIEISDFQYKTLCSGMEILNKAMAWLKETPLRAAGFNIRFKADRPPSELRCLLDSRADGAFSDEELTIIDRGFHRGFSLGEGEVNFDINLDKNGMMAVNVNFNRVSEDRDQLIAWMGLSIESIESTVGRVLRALIPESSRGETNERNSVPTSPIDALPAC